MSSVVTKLPFSGVLRISDIVNNIEAINKVKVCNIISMASRASGEDYEEIVNGYVRPKFGYFKIETLDINYKKYLQYEI